MSSCKVFIGLPSYDGRRGNSVIYSQLNDTPGVDFFALEAHSSLLTYSFNQTLAAALNARDQRGITHYLLLHDDVVPQDPKWFVQLLGEMEASRAQVLSVIIPLKSLAGLTSTALESSNFWMPRRLSMTEVMARPVTWTDPALLFNTGMMLVDIRRPWIEQMCFTVNDRIVKRDGQWHAEVEPEDWHFSRQCRHAGVPTFVTRRVAVHHIGKLEFDNESAWGIEKTDPVHSKARG